MSKPIVVQLTKDSDGWAKGAELGYASEADAKKAHGDNFKIVRYVDSSAYEPPIKEKNAKPSDIPDIMTEPLPDSLVRGTKKP